MTGLRFYEELKLYRYTALLNVQYSSVWRGATQRRADVFQRHSFGAARERELVAARRPDLWANATRWQIRSRCWRQEWRRSCSESF